MTTYRIIRQGDWFNDRFVGYYELDNCGYFRRPKTFNERKQNLHAGLDGYHVRGRRRKLPTSWDDIRYSWQYGRCWKRFTKKRKQYGAER